MPRARRSTSLTALLARIDRLLPKVTHPQFFDNLKRRRSKLAKLAGAPASEIAKALELANDWLELRYRGFK